MFSRLSGSALALLSDLVFTALPIRVLQNIWLPRQFSKETSEMHLDVG
jgi:hypothetical protein